MSSEFHGPDCDCDECFEMLMAEDFDDYKAALAELESGGSVVPPDEFFDEPLYYSEEFEFDAGGEC